MTIQDLSYLLITMVSLLSGWITWIWAHFERKFARCDVERKELSGRVVALELAGSDMPRWVRDAGGIIRSVTSEFVHLFGTPLGLTSKDFVGRKIEDVEGLNPNLIKSLRELDQVASKQRCASRSRVEVSPGCFATVSKFVRTNSIGEPVFIGIACPETDAITIDQLVRPTKRRRRRR